MKRATSFLLLMLCFCGGERQASGPAESSPAGGIQSNDEVPHGAAPCFPPDQVTLVVPRVGQETRSWCWAASGQMVMGHLGQTVTQCDQANKELNLTACCNPNPGRSCIQGGWPPFEEYGFEAQQTSNTPLTWDQIREEIGCHRRPVAFSWKYDGGGGHMMTMVGYTTISGARAVVVHDPWPVGKGDSRTITYAAYSAAKRKYRHWNDYYAVQKKVSP